MKLNKMIKVVAIAATFFVGGITTANADRDQGVDWSVYQSALGKTGYKSDKFAISQIGGVTANGIYDQSTYKTQVASGTALGLRMHTYIWWQDVYNNQRAKQVLDYFLDRMQTPKGSIVALDCESGYQNTAVIDYALQYLKDKGYTAMLYGYKGNLLNNVNLNYLSSKYPLWLAEYPDYQVRSKPNYGFFPSFNNVQLFQFTSTYIAGGLDGNVDLTGITQNGYKANDKPKQETPAIANGQQAKETPKADIKVGDTVNINLSASKWATGEGIIDSVKGKSYKVLQVNGNKVLLDKVYSWINKSDIKIVVLDKPIKTITQNVNSNSSFVDILGDKWVNESGTFTLNQTINLRWGARTSSSIVATLPAGASVNYDAYSIHNGYVWIRQRRGNTYAYLATGEAINGRRTNYWGTFK